MPVGVSDFSLLQNIKIGSVAHTTSHSVGTVVLPGAGPGHEADISSPSIAEVKNAWKCLYVPSWTEKMLPLPLPLPFTRLQLQT